MRKQSMRFAGLLVLLLIFVACTGTPPTQIVIVLSPTHEPATITALTEEAGGAPATAVQTESGVLTATPPAATESTAVEITSTEPPTGTAAPTLTPSATLDPRFPTPLVTQIQVAEQVFENGRMFWLQPNDEIWVMIKDDPDVEAGEWIIAENTFFEGDVEFVPSLTPPVGAQQPRRGFGTLWRESDEIRQAIGWATLPEFGFVTTYEYRPGGYLNSDGEFVPGPGTHILISLGNEAFAFDEADFTWRLVE